jgi:EAL domain-containing protein (putative c-di-GMP-specific phosphodiesterase class I)
MIRTVHMSGERRFTNRQQFHAAGSETRISGRLEMETRLRRALELGQLELHYQPQASLSDGAMNAVEALLRWNDPVLGCVPPEQLIQLAEETGLIHAIGAWVLETAAAQARGWRDAGLHPVRMCVNVSATQLNAGLVETVSRVLQRTGLPASAFELELTEGVMLARDRETAAAIQALRALGVEFAIDDFGTGHATFEYVKLLPVSTLKLAGSFVRGVCDKADVAIVGACISLARTLGLRVVAEGVETAEQCERLRKLGCHDYQGYYIARPMPATALEKLLTDKPRAVRSARAQLALAK